MIEQNEPPNREYNASPSKSNHEKESQKESQVKLPEGSNIKTNNTVKSGTFQENSSSVTNSFSQNSSGLQVAQAYLAVTDDTLKGKASNVEGASKAWVVHHVEHLPVLALQVLDRVIWHATQQPHRPIFLGYDDLAKKWGCHRNSIYNNVKRLVKEGLISIQHHSYNGNQYRINSIFYDLTIRRWLKHVLPSLRLTMKLFTLSLSLLVSVQRDIPTETCDANRDRDIYINRTVESNYVGKVCARARQPLRTVLKTKKERVEMYQESVVLIKQGGLRSIALTAWGIKNIACFPVEAIQFADTKMQGVKGAIRDRYAMFKGFCLEYCKVQGVWPDFSSVDAFRMKNPEVTELAYYTERPEDILKNRDEEAQPYQRPTSDWNPRHAYKPKDITGGDPVVTIAQAGVAERSAGREPNEYLKILLGESEFRPEKKITYETPDMLGWKKPTVTVKSPVAELQYIPLPAAELELVNRVLENSKYLPETEMAHKVLIGIAQLMSQGVTHPLASNIDFWNGLRFILPIMEKEKVRHQALAREKNFIDVQTALV